MLSNQRKHAILVKLAAQLADIPPKRVAGRTPADYMQIRAAALAPGGMTTTTSNFPGVFTNFPPAKAQPGYMSQLPSGGAVSRGTVLQNVPPALPDTAGPGARAFYNSTIPK